MNIYEKNGKRYEVFCACNRGDRSFVYDCIEEGEFDTQCPTCNYYYWYYRDTPLTEDCDNDTVEVKSDSVTEDCVNDTEEVEEEETLTCDECGEECSELTETEEGKLCKDCLSDKFIFCQECQSWQYYDDSEPYDGGHVCSSCYDENYFTCDRCGKVHRTDEQNRIHYRRDDESWCDHCADNYAYRCQDCEELFTENSLMYNGEATLCNSCGCDYNTCEDCGAVVHYDNSYYSEEDDCTYCESCYHDNKSNRRIKDYNYKPSAEFHGKGPLYLGVELEMECSNRSDTAEALHELSSDEDLFYIKSDGSLNNGIELVTHPCSLTYHKEDYGWTDILKKAVSYGAKSHDTSTCGIHVHLSRKFFTLSEITRFVAFVNVHGDHLKVLARRGASDYSRFKNKKDGIKRLVNQEERYEAVNLYNSRTIEVRIFKGTLKESTLMSCIEVCDAMARFIKTSNIASIIGKSEENWEQFLTYVTNNLEMYSYLHSYMIKKGLIKVVALPPTPLVELASLPEEIILPWEELYAEAA